VSRTLCSIGATLILLSAASAAAQTIRPVVSEYQTRARGRVELVNDSDRPLNVVLEPRSFTVDENGMVKDEPLSNRIHLKLSAMSVRIPARETRFVFYEATTDQAPAWFVVYANFTGYSQTEFNGLTVQLELPHFVYLFPKQRWKAGDVRVADVERFPDAHKLVLVVENRGQQFGRIEGLQVQSPQHRVTSPGFPLFPGTRRRLELAWETDDIPESVLLKARDFSFDQKLPSQPSQR